MIVTATMDAGFSPVFNTTIVAGQNYEIPDGTPLPEFFTPVPPPQAAPVDTKTATKGGTP